MIKFVLPVCYVSMVLSSPSYGMENGEESREYQLTARLKELGQQKTLSEKEAEEREKTLNAAYADLKTLKSTMKEFESRLPQPLGQQLQPLSRSRQLKTKLTRFKDNVAQFVSTLVQESESDELVISEVLSTNITQNMSLDEIEGTFPGLMISLSTELDALGKRVAEMQSSKDKTDHEQTLVQFRECFLTSISKYQKNLKKRYEDPDRLSTEVSHDLKKEHDLAATLLQSSQNHSPQAVVSPGRPKEKGLKQIPIPTAQEQEEVKGKRSTLERLKEGGIAVETPLSEVGPDISFKLKLNTVLGAPRKKSGTLSQPSSPSLLPRVSGKKDSLPLASLKRSNTAPSGGLPRPKNIIMELQSKFTDTSKADVEEQLSPQMKRTTLPPEQEWVLIGLVSKTVGAPLKGSFSHEERLLVKLLQQVVERDPQ